MIKKENHKIKKIILSWSTYAIWKTFHFFYFGQQSFGIWNLLPYSHQVSITLLFILDFHIVPSPRYVPKGLVRRYSFERAMANCWIFGLQMCRLSLKSVRVLFRILTIVLRSWGNLWKLRSSRRPIFIILGYFNIIVEFSTWTRRQP